MNILPVPSLFTLNPIAFRDGIRKPICGIMWPYNVCYWRFLQMCCAFAYLRIKDAIVSSPILIPAIQSIVGASWVMKVHIRSYVLYQQYTTHESHQTDQLHFWMQCSSFPISWQWFWNQAIYEVTVFNAAPQMSCDSRPPDRPVHKGNNNSANVFFCETSWAIVFIVLSLFFVKQYVTLLPLTVQPSKRRISVKRS